MTSAQNAAIAHFFAILVSLLSLEVALIRSDFSMKFVAQNSSSAYPIWYKIAGLWSALEGSILLWSFLQAGFTALVIFLYGRRPFVGARHAVPLLPYVIAVLLSISSFFLLVMLIPANPFERLSPPPAEGRGMNPLLEDTSMLVHPLLLYLGYVGFSVPYAFGMAALLTGRLSEEWLLITRRWTVLAWLFLTGGIIYGGFWSYHVLGWGGYWAWDPVENASIMPWFAGTAFLHSVMIQEKRRMLKVWNIILITLTFALVIFGTFLTRSGILSSVHAFAQGTIGYFFLTYLSLILLASLAGLILRANQLKSPGALDSLVSRESAFLLNNLVLVGLCFTVFLGTIFPLLAEAVTGVKVSVGAPYFNQVAIPFALVLLFLMGVGPLIAWRRTSVESLRRNLLLPSIVACTGGVLLFFLGLRGPYVILAIVASLFVASSVLIEFYRGVKVRRSLDEAFLRAFLNLLFKNRRRYGGLIVHLGVVLIVIGLAFSSTHQVEREQTLRLGEQLEIGRYVLTFEGLSASQGPTFTKVEALVEVHNNGKLTDTLQPALRFSQREQTPITEVDYRIGLFEDLYLILGRVERDGRAATVKALINPMVSWIWLGGAVMALGGLLALWPERHPSRRRAEYQTLDLSKSSGKMRTIAIIILLLGSLPQLSAFGGERDIEAEARQIASLLRCPVCQNLSVADSPAELAQEMQGLVKERLLKGESREEVLAYFISKYGEWVLLAPPKRGFNLFIWILPTAFVLGGLGGIAILLRRWVRRGEGQSLEEEGGEIDPRYRERLDRELQD